MPLKPQFDNRISIGTVLQIGAIVVGGIIAFQMVKDQAEDNTSAITDLKQAVTQDVAAIDRSVRGLERKVETDLSHVAKVVEDVEEKVDTVITEQSTAAMRIEAIEEEHSEMETSIDSTRALAVTVQSNSNRDRAVQSERHETLLSALKDLKSSVRRFQFGGDTP